MKHVVITMETESKTFVAAAGTLPGAKREIVKAWNEEQRKAHEYFGDGFKPQYIGHFESLDMIYGCDVYAFDSDGYQVK